MNAIDLNKALRLKSESHEMQLEALYKRVRALDAYLAHNLTSQHQDERITARKEIRDLESVSEHALAIHAENEKLFGSTLALYADKRVTSEWLEALDVGEYAEISELVAERSLWVHLGYHCHQNGVAYIVETNNLNDWFCCAGDVGPIMSSETVCYHFTDQREAKQMMCALLMVHREI